MDKIKKLVQKVLPFYILTFFSIAIISIVLFYMPNIVPKIERNVIYDLIIIAFSVMNCVLVPFVQKRIFRVFLDISIVLFFFATTYPTSWVWAAVIIFSILGVMIVYRKKLKKPMLRIIAVIVALTQVFAFITFAHLFLEGVPFQAISNRIVKGPNEKYGLKIQEYYNFFTGDKLESVIVATELPVKNLFLFDCFPSGEKYLKDTREDEFEIKWIDENVVEISGREYNLQKKFS